MSSKNIKIILSFFLTAIFLSVFFIITGFLIGKKAGFNDAFNLLSQRLKEAGFISLEERGIEIKSISGQVKSITENKIILETEPLSLLEDPDLKTRIVDFDKNTEIFKMEGVEISEAGERKIKWKRTDISEIKDGSLLTVNAGENIEDKKTFKALQIFTED